MKSPDSGRREKNSTFCVNPENEPLTNTIVETKRSPGVLASELPNPSNCQAEKYLFEGNQDEVKARRSL